MTTNRVKEILGWYNGESPALLGNLYRLLMQGRLGGTGRLIILPVDQGFEHGPARSFAPNPPGYNPHYHFQLAIDAGLSGYAAPLGFLEAGAADFAGQVPLILKANSHDVLHEEANPMGALTASPEDALRLGCVGVGYTIYPGTADRRFLYEQLREVVAEAKAYGLLSVVWSYPRGGELSREGETALDVTAYAAQIAAQMGAHIIKVKLPSAHLEQPAAAKVYEKYGVPRATMAERVRHVVQSAFDGRRVVIFSGGAKEDDEEAIYQSARAIRDGGGFGSIIGRNTFQRERADALAMLDRMIRIYRGEEQGG
jgi:class I fructose-bisphosphate aldolase